MMSGDQFRPTTVDSGASPVQGSAARPPMRSLVNWLRRYLRDSIVLRVCVFIYGALFVAMGFVAMGLALAVAFTPPEPLEWLAVALGLAIAGFSAYMAYASVFGRLRILEKAANAVSYGGELLVIVLVLPVFMAAIPIAGLVKRIRSPRRLF